MIAWIEKLPAPVRHIAAVFIGTYAAVVIGAILAAEGVTAVEWSGTLVDGLNKAAVVALTVILTLYITPLTNAYGVGKEVDNSAPSTVPSGDPDGVQPREDLASEASEAGGDELPEDGNA
jgi:hypothetical protein